jgi:hypothetical protein
MKTIIPLIPLLLLFSCKEKIQKIESNQIIDTSHLSSIKIKSSDEFDIINVAQFIALFKEPELIQYNKNVSKAFKQYLGQSTGFWATKRLMINDTLKVLKITGYPLSLRIFKGELKRITTVTESENQRVILAWILDKNYNVIDAHQLTTHGGDENVVAHIYGKFINDTLYSYVDKLYQYYDNGVVDSTTQSVQGCLIFTSTGQISPGETCR